MRKRQDQSWLERNAPSMVLLIKALAVLIKSLMGNGPT